MLRYTRRCTYVRTVSTRASCTHVQGILHTCTHMYRGILHTCTGHPVHTCTGASCTHVQGILHTCTGHPAHMYRASCTHVQGILHTRMYRGVMHTCTHIRTLYSRVEIEYLLLGTSKTINKSLSITTQPLPHQHSPTPNNQAPPQYTNKAPPSITTHPSHPSHPSHLRKASVLV